MDIKTNSNKHIGITKQIKNRVNYEKKIAKAKGETVTHVYFVGDLVNSKKYNFKLLSMVPLTCNNELELQILGGFIFDLGQLELLPTKGVK